MEGRAFKGTTGAMIHMFSMRRRGVARAKGARRDLVRKKWLGDVEEA